MGEERLLDPKFLPESLWSARTGRLRLPQSLCDIYRQIIEDNGLGELWKIRSRGGPVGGLSKAQTDEHFAHSFSGSAARTLLAVLDPKDEVGLTSNTFIESAAGASVCITDAPCGAGAAAAVFLCALAELRSKSILPRLPLEVRLIGGELSPHAIEYAMAIMARLEPVLAEQAIVLKHDFVSWDVTCGISTAGLVRRSVIAGDAKDRRLLMVANFSGFLQAAGNRAKAMNQLNELFRYVSVQNTDAVWIEPQTNEVVQQGGLFEWLRKNMATTWRRFARPKPAAPAIAGELKTEAEFHHPLDANITARVHLAIIPIALGES